MRKGEEGRVKRKPVKLGVAHLLFDREMRSIPLWKFRVEKGNRIAWSNVSYIEPETPSLWWLQRMYENEVTVGICIREINRDRKVRYVLDHVMEEDGKELWWEFVLEEKKTVDAIARIRVYNR